MFTFPVSVLSMFILCCLILNSMFCIFFQNDPQWALSHIPGLHGNNDVAESWKSWKCISHYLFCFKWPSDWKSSFGKSKYIKSLQRDCQIWISFSAVIFCLTWFLRCWRTAALKALLEPVVFFTCFCCLRLYFPISGVAIFLSLHFYALSRRLSKRNWV